MLCNNIMLLDSLIHIDESIPTTLCIFFFRILHIHMNKLFNISCARMTIIILYMIMEIIAM